MSLKIFPAKHDLFGLNPSIKSFTYKPYVSFKCRNKKTEINFSLFSVTFVLNAFKVWASILSFLAEQIFYFGNEISFFFFFSFLFCSIFVGKTTSCRVRKKGPKMWNHYWCPNGKVVVVSGLHSFHFSLWVLIKSSTITLSDEQYYNKKKLRNELIPTILFSLI